MIQTAALGWEDGVAARTMAAYIDLNPVRAGMVKEPAEYLWSNYREVISGCRFVGVDTLPKNAKARCLAD